MLFWCYFLFVVVKTSGGAAVTTMPPFLQMECFVDATAAIACTVGGRSYPQVVVWSGVPLSRSASVR